MDGLTTGDTLFPIHSCPPPPKKKIPQGMVWLEGDNPFNSTDSRSYGPVPLALVKGLVSFKVSQSLARVTLCCGRPISPIDTYKLNPHNRPLP